MTISYFNNEQTCVVEINGTGISSGFSMSPHHVGAIFTDHVFEILYQGENVKQYTTDIFNKYSCLDMAGVECIAK